MTGKRMLTDAELAAIKAATRRLVRAAGGVEAAAMSTRVGKTQLADYASVNRPDSFMPADVIADLERETGAPEVTRALCAAAGGAFVPVAARMEDSDWMRRFAAAGKEAADVFQRGYEALAEDGEVDAAEAAALVVEVNEAVEAFATLRHALQRVAGIAPGGVVVVQPAARGEG